MRLHENKEGDELQRLRARRQGTGRNYKNRPRQTKTVDHTYDEDYYEEEDYDYEYEEEPDPNGLEVPFENDNRRSAGVSHRYSEYSNQAEKSKMASYSFKPFSGALCIWRLVFPSQSYGILEYCGIWCRQP